MLHISQSSFPRAQHLLDKSRVAVKTQSLHDLTDARLTSQVERSMRNDEEMLDALRAKLAALDV